MALLRVWNGATWVKPYYNKTRIWNGSQWAYTKTKFWKDGEWKDSFLTINSIVYDDGVGQTILAPANSFKVVIKVWGGGGAGSSIIGGYGGGGGGGAYCEKTMPVTAGVTSFTYSVAAQTAAVAYGEENPPSGYYSEVTGAATLYAGGGYSGYGNPANGGLGGSATGGDLNITGGAGQPGTYFGGDGSGGSGAYGGGAGGSGNGVNGTAPGGGGSGGQNAAGGRGAAGRIIFDWYISE
jgi:hypothetical protein